MAKELTERQKKNRRIYRYLTLPAGIVVGFLVAIIMKEVLGFDMGNKNVQYIVAGVTIAAVVISVIIMKRWVEKRYS